MSRSTLPLSRRLAVRVALLSLFGGTTLLLAGCPSPSSTGDAGTSGTPGAASTPASGDTAGGSGAGATGNKLVIEGSDTLQPLSQKWAENFKAKNAQVEISVTGGGSGQGITQLINGAATIANASREATEKEKAQAKEKGFELTETAVARDGITIVVHPSNPVKSLTLEQLANIYTGKAKNWSEVGGPNLPIVASGRETTSGTYKYFQEDVLDKAEYRQDMISTPSNNAIAQNVSTQKGGIGYIGIAYASEFTKQGKLKEVPVAFKAGDAPVLPTEETILSGNYPISRELFNYTRNAPEGVAKQYLDYVTGPDGQKVVAEQGFIPLKK